MEILADNLLFYRAQAGLSQPALSKSAGVVRATIARIESGVAVDVGVVVLERLARAIGVSVGELLSG